MKYLTKMDEVIIEAYQMTIKAQQGTIDTLLKLIKELEKELISVKGEHDDKSSKSKTN